MKIIKKPEIKPVTCAICGCVYRPKIKEVCDGYLTSYKNAARCPICDYKNDVEFVKEEK